MTVILSVIKEVYQRRIYIWLTFAFGLVFLLMTVLVSNLTLLFQLFFTQGPILLKAKTLIWLAWGITTNFTLINIFLVIVIAFLFGIYLSLFIFFVKKRQKILGVEKAGFFGSILGVMGVGCSSCGAIVLSMILSTSGAATAISLLPLKGSEFALLSLIVLSFSIHTLSKNIVNVGLCKIP
jgi:hypothetical protein